MNSSFRTAISFCEVLFQQKNFHLKENHDLIPGIFSRTYNSIPPPFLLRSNLKTVWNPSIKNWPCEKLSSSFDSDITKTWIDPSICSQRKSNLVFNELMFKCPKTNLLILLVRISLRIHLAFVVIVLEAFSDS